MYCSFYIGQQPNILIADLDILKQIMVKEFDNFTDHAVSQGSIPTPYTSTINIVTCIDSIMINMQFLR